MNSYVKTLIGCGAGLISAYVIGRVCFEVGRDVERLDQMTTPVRQPDISEVPTAIPEKTTELMPVPAKKRGFFGGLGAVKDIIKRPEDHKFEASIEGDSTVIRIKRKTEATRKLQTV